MSHVFKATNFKSLRDVTLTLERLNVVVGPNACGKTSLLDALWCISAIDGNSRLNSPFQNRLEIENVLSRTADPSEFLLKLNCSDNAWATFTLRDKVRLKEEGTGGSLFPRGYFRFVLSKLASPSYTNDLAPQMGEDGSHLANVLSHYALANPDLYAEIQSLVRQLVPGVQRFRLERAMVSIQQPSLPHMTMDVVGDQIVFDMKSGDGIPADNVSEGTLFALGLATALVTPNLKLLLLDDVDRGFHPRAQATVVKILKEALKLRPNLTIVATSHSPYLLAHLDPEEVIVMTSDEESGASLCARLLDHPEFEKWKDLMDTGEFWSSVGEDWVRDLRKSHE